MANLLGGMAASTQAKGGHAAEPEKQAFKVMVGPPGSKTAKYARKDAEVLGRGATGQALLVTRVSDGALFVAKEMDLEAMSDNDRRYAYSEIKCLGACNHFAVLKFVEEAEEGGMLLIISEFGDAGDLRRHIKARAQDGMRYFPERDVWQIFVQLCLALEHIHSRRMLHRDIKCANVFLSSTGLIKVGDFGFSALYDETVSQAVAASLVGTPYYLAPELWRGERYGKKADMWSLGIILYELMALKRPFEAASLRDIKEVVLAAKGIPPLPSSYSQDLQDICKSLLNPNIEARPSAAQVLALPPMQKYLSTFEQNVAVTEGLSAEMKQHIYESLKDYRERASSTLMGASTTTSDRPIIIEGILKKESQGTGQWKDRRLTLDSKGVLTIGLARRTSESPEKGSEVSILCRDIKNVFPIPRSRMQHGFEIHLKQGAYLRFQAADTAEQDRWIGKLQHAAGIV